jgi:hypothetical protein
LGDELEGVYEAALGSRLNSSVFRPTKALAASANVLSLIDSSSVSVHRKYSAVNKKRNDQPSHHQLCCCYGGILDRSDCAREGVFYRSNPTLGLSNSDFA